MSKHERMLLHEIESVPMRVPSELNVVFDHFTFSAEGIVITESKLKLK